MNRKWPLLFLLILVLSLCVGCTGAGSEAEGEEASSHKKTVDPKKYDPQIGVIYNNGSRSKDMEDPLYSVATSDSASFISGNYEDNGYVEDNNEFDNTGLDNKDIEDVLDASEDSGESVNSVSGGADLFNYLGKKESDINAVLGEPNNNTNTEMRLYDGFNGTVQLYNDDVYMITLLGRDSYSILGLHAGDSTESIINKLVNEYGAKERTIAGSNQKQYYFYVGDDVRFVDFQDSNGVADSISCSYDLTGIFVEPTDVSGKNSFTFSGDIDSIGY